MQITLNFEQLTLGQAEFLCDYTGRTIDQLEEAITGGLTARDVVAIVAVSRQPDNPQAAVERVRSLKVSDLTG
jgi:hypothetical protein